MSQYETKRLVLKTLTKDDAPLVLDYYLRNKHFIEEFEGLKVSDYYTLERQQTILGIDENLMNEGKYLRFWIFKKEDETKIIGTLGFSDIIRGIFQNTFLGYKLDEQELNKGYMTEALNKGVEIMFKEQGLHRIEANVMPRNKRSLRVLEKCGFINEGTARNYLKINGVWEDHIHMVKLNEED